MILLTLLATALATVSIGPIVLKPADYLDGRAIAGPTGAPLVMLTLTPGAAARLKKAKADAIAIDGTPASARIVANTIEIEGQSDFDAAAALALKISGKPPLPDSLDE